MCEPLSALLEASVGSPTLGEPFAGEVLVDWDEWGRLRLSPCMAPGYLSIPTGKLEGKREPLCSWMTLNFLMSGLENTILYLTLSIMTYQAGRKCSQCKATSTSEVPQCVRCSGVSRGRSGGPAEWAAARDGTEERVCMLVFLGHQCPEAPSVWEGSIASPVCIVLRLKTEQALLMEHCVSCLAHI